MPTHLARTGRNWQVCRGECGWPARGHKQSGAQQQACYASSLASSFFFFFFFFFFSFFFFFFFSSSSSFVSLESHVILGLTGQECRSGCGWPARG